MNPSPLKPAFPHTAPWCLADGLAAAGAIFSGLAVGGLWGWPYGALVIGAALFLLALAGERRIAK